MLCLQLILFHCMILFKSDFNVLSLCFDIFGFRFGLFLAKEGKRATRQIMFWSWNVPTFVWVEKSKSWLVDSSSNNKHSYSIKKFQQPVGISCFNGLCQGTLLKGKTQYIWTPHKDSLFCNKEKYFFSTKSSWFEQVSARRSTILIFPIQLGFSALAICTLLS